MKAFLVIALLSSLCATAWCAVVCGEYSYEGNFTVSTYNAKSYVSLNLEWIVVPPLEVRLFGDHVLVNHHARDDHENEPINLTEFAASYPWAIDTLLFDHSRLVSYSLSSIAMGAPEKTDLRSCRTHHDALNFYWDSIPLGNMFSTYPVLCNEERPLEFAIDPAAHMVKDAWGDRPRRPYDGRHFYPRNGRASFATIVAHVNKEKPRTIPLTVDYYSGVSPSLRSVSVRTCTNVDIDGYSNALVRRYNETRHEMAKRDIPAQEEEGNDEHVPNINDEKEADQWIINQLRAQGVLVDLPPVGKLAPPEPVRPKPPPGPYDPELFDPDAFVAPGDNLAQQQGVVSVQGAPDAQEVIADGRLWPTLECVHHRTDGTCIAAFGYVYSGTTGLDVPVADEDNWFEPNEFLTDFRLPTHFEPGSHRNAFVIRWWCRGSTIGSWNNIYWTLHGSTVSATVSTPRCGEDSEAQQELDDAVEAIQKVQHDERRGHLFGRKLLQEETTTPPETTLPDETTTPPPETTLPDETTTPPPETTLPDETTTPPPPETTLPDETTTPPETTLPDETTTPPPETTLPDETTEPPEETTAPPCDLDGGSCSGELQPRLECSHNFENGTCVAYFGYLNLANTSVSRPVGFPLNYFTPIDEDQGQPDLFLPGRQYNVFTVYWDCQPSSGVPNSITWVLNTTATAGSAVHNTCPVGCDDIPYSDTVDCPTDPPSEDSSLGISSGSSSSTESSSSSLSSSFSSSSFSSAEDSSSSASISSSSSTGVMPTTCPPQDPCSFTASLTLYRDRNFTLPYRPRKKAPPMIEALDTAYGLVSLDVPTDWLGDFCLNVKRVVQCLCNDTYPCVPFNPSKPGVTGCNSPGVEKRVIYRQTPLIEDDGFQFEEDPPAYCSGQRAFSWDQQLIAPPGYKLLVQADWTYSTLNGEHACQGTSQGGSGATFTCGCPDSHKWNATCQCCQSTNVNVTVNVQVTVINIVNISVPDGGASAVSAIAAATASVATATLTATTGTTGVNIIVKNNLPWWAWLILAFTGIPLALLSLVCLFCCLGVLSAPPPPRAECEPIVAVEESCDPCQENRAVGQNGMPVPFDNLYAVPVGDASSRLVIQDGKWIYKRHDA